MVENGKRTFYDKLIKLYMNLSLEGKIAVVCGSSQGIGKSAAIELATLGAKIVLLARNKENLEKM